MEPVTFSFEGKNYIGFEADAVFEVCGRFRDLIRGMLTLSTSAAPALPVKSSEATSQRGGASAVIASAPPVRARRQSKPAPHHRHSASANRGSAEQEQPSPVVPAVPSSSSGTAGAAKPNGAAGLVLQAMRDIKEGDIRAILERLGERAQSLESNDPERTVASALYQTLGPKHLVEKVEGKRGWWRLAA